MTHIISLSNQKGGVGKTGVTTNLGACIAELGYRTLLVDLDPQANLTSSFGIDVDSEISVAEALLDLTIDFPIRQIHESLHLVPSSLALASTEVNLFNKLGREFRLRDRLRKIETAYDYILIDTPPSLGLLTINSLVAANSVIVPSEARYFSLRGLKMLMQSIEEIKMLNPNLFIVGIVLNKFDKRLREEQNIAEYMRENFPTLMFETTLGVNSKVLEAASAGVPIVRYSGAGKVADAYMSLAREVVNRVH